MQPIYKAWCCQIDITSYCTHSCLYCSRYNRHLRHDQRIHMDIETFTTALESLKKWPSKIGIIGGEPLLHPKFREFNKLLRKYFPQSILKKSVQKIFRKQLQGNPKLGLWTSGSRAVPNPNLDTDIISTYGLIAYNPHDPEQVKKCRHQPLTVAINEVIEDENLMWQLIDNCWVQRTWCPSITYKGAYFCEVAAAQDLLLNDGANAWPITKDWWRHTPEDPAFIRQKNALCPNCGMAIPMERELLEKKTEKITPQLLEKFKKANLKSISNNDIELYTNKISKEMIIQNISNWYPGNYREDIKEDKNAGEGLGFIGSIK